MNNDDCVIEDRYDFELPLGESWDIYYQVTLADEVTPFDLTDYGLRMQFRIPGALYPTLELTTAGFYNAAPTLWPSYELLTITPLTGEIRGVIPPNVVGLLSPNNTVIKFEYDIERVKPIGLSVPNEVLPMTWPANEYMKKLFIGEMTTQKRATY